MTFIELRLNFIHIDRSLGANDLESRAQYILSKVRLYQNLTVVNKLSRV